MAHQDELPVHCVYVLVLLVGRVKDECLRAVKVRWLLGRQNIESGGYQLDNSRAASRKNNQGFYKRQ